MEGSQGSGAVRSHDCVNVILIRKVSEHNATAKYLDNVKLNKEVIVQ